MASFLLAGTLAASAAFASPEVVSWAFSGGLRPGWQDHGWSPRKPRAAGEPERHLMGSYGGWILAHQGPVGTFGALTFQVRTFPPTGDDFLEVQLESPQADLPPVKVTAAHRKPLADGWSEVLVSMEALNPMLQPFTTVRMRAFRPLPDPGLVEFDFVGFTAPDPALQKKLEAQRNAPGVPATFVVDCGATAKDISPLIYGIAFNAQSDATNGAQWKLNATTRRWGGNPTSRYNWEISAWNTANDYFFENVDPAPRAGFTWKTFLDDNRAHGMHSAVTVPILGWVAKDTSSVSFPRAQFPDQKQFDPDGRNAGNGVGSAGPILNFDQSRTSVAAPPDFVARWVKAITEHEKKPGKTVGLYFLDNEPMLWGDTHRDVHPLMPGYDELLERTVKYASAVKQASPDTLIAGPAEWGWPAYFHSAIDAKAGFRLRPDRRAHGDVPLVEWWLQKLTAHQKKTGVRLVDVLDFHFYAQGNNIGVGTAGSTDADTNARRIRATRGLWDPTYVDESWINEPVRLIPRMKELVAKHAPGLKVAIGEWNFGAERHMSGGLATAEALGRFGTEGLYAAWYWTFPQEGTPAFWAFRAFRDFDGKGATFAEQSLPTKGPEGASLFAAKSADGSRMTLVALNFSTKDALEAAVTLKGCPAATSQRVFTYAGGPMGLEAREVAVGAPYRLAPYSMSVIELTLPVTKRK